MARVNYAIHNAFFLILGWLYQIEHKQRSIKIKMSISPVKMFTGRIPLGLTISDMVISFKNRTGNVVVL